jgi:hypothetical protein
LCTRIFTSTDLEIPVEIITQILNFLEGKQFRRIRLSPEECESAAACLCWTLSCSEPSRIQDGGKLGTSSDAISIKKNKRNETTGSNNVY